MTDEYYYKRELLGLLQGIAKDKALFAAFFEDILTPAEYADISKRWQIVKDLERGISQRRIARNLRVGVGTITRGSRELLDEAGGFKQVLKFCRKNPKICRV